MTIERGRCAALLEIAPDVILVRDMDDHFTFWNAGAQRVYGWTREEALGRGSELLFPPESRGEIENARIQVLETGTWSGDFHERRRDGSEIVVEAHWALIRDAAGIPTGIMSVARDVTAERSMKDALLRSQRLESVGTLAVGIAHDLNNILTPIVMGIGEIQSEVTGDRGREVLEIMARSAARGAGIVSQILQYTRGACSKRVPTSIGAMIGETARMIREMFPREIMIETRVPDGLWSVIGDPTQVQQVLINTAVNARDSMPGGGTITLSARNTVLHGNDVPSLPGARPIAYVVIEVTDTGCGMPRDVISRIFEPFFTTKKNGAGTGLGLPITRAIVADHGGFIDVASEVGQGTRFMVYLPATGNDDRMEGNGGEQAEARGKGELILVVDDEDALRRVTSVILQSSGYAVLEAENGASALELFRSSRGEVRLIFTDVRMPVLDGPDLVSAARLIDPDIPVVITSGIASGAQDPALRGVIPDGFLPKPYETTALLAVVRRALDRQKTD